MSIEEILSIWRWLDDDRDTAYAQRVQRDRALGRAITDTRPAERIAAWWHAISEPSPSPASPATVDPRIPKVSTYIAVGRLALFAVGIALGVGVAGAAFAYEGRYPVNLFALLGLLVVLPGISFLLTLLLLPPRKKSIGGLQNMVSALNPGRWLGHVFDRSTGLDLFEWRASAGAVASFGKWQTIVFSQWLAIGFFAGAVGLALLLVIFSDLAFGWSTTLDFDPAFVYSILSTMAYPWSGWLAVATPDPGLVEASQYFRIRPAAGADDQPLQAARLGEWWPFVCMTIIVYGLLPRLLLLGVGIWRLPAVRNRLLLSDPKVTALLDRLDTPSVGYESDVHPAVVANAPVANMRESSVAGEATLVIWNDSIQPDQARRLLTGQYAISGGQVLKLGSLMSATERSQAMQSIVNRQSRVVVLTKGWEPPLLEFLDALEELRTHLDQDVSISVVPVSTGGDAVNAPERDIWARTVARLGDGQVYVVDASQ